MTRAPSDEIRFTIHVRRVTRSKQRKKRNGATDATIICAQDDRSASDFSRDISCFHKLKISSSLPFAASRLCVRPLNATVSFFFLRETRDEKRTTKKTQRRYGATVSFFFRATRDERRETKRAPTERRRLARGGNPWKDVCPLHSVLKVRCRNFPAAFQATTGWEAPVPGACLQADCTPG